MKNSIVCVLSFILFFSCTDTNIHNQKLAVFVSILPQKYFLEQIGGKFVDVSVLVEPGASPHNYEPKPQQMAALTKARLFFAIGVEFENAWLPRIQNANPGLKIVHTDSGIIKIPQTGFQDFYRSAAGESSVDTASDPEHHDHKGGADPHIWLSPANVLCMAATMTRALCLFDSAHAREYARQNAAFADTIGSLQKQITALTGNTGGRKFMVFHPSWGYFAAEFGLTQVPIEFEGKEPSPRALKFCIDYARKNGIKTVFVQPQFSQSSAAVLAGEIGGTTRIADDLAYDWVRNLRAAGTAFINEK